VEGLVISGATEDFYCTSCQEGKLSKKPYHAVEQKRKYLPGEMSHVDLSGKMGTKSLGGSLYFMLIKDDSTGFRMVYFLKEKSLAGNSIKEYISFMKTQTGNKMKIVKSDCGTEFVNTELKSYFSKKGIVHETTVPYCPQSNGSIEREMRTIKDTARAMLQHKNVPEFLWAEAVATSVYIHNRTLNKQSSEVTALEVIMKKKPNLSHLRVFGTEGFYHVPDQKRHTWTPKGRKCILVGYDGMSSNYKVYDPELRCTIVVRNVSFNELHSQERVKLEVSRHDDSKPENEIDTEPEDENIDGVGHIENLHGNQPELEDNDEGAELQPVRRHPMVLRDRSTLNKPAWYHALSAEAIIEPYGYKEALESPQADKWKVAMDDEMNSLIENKTWNLVKYPSKGKILDCRWTFKLKKNPDHSIARYKARLVIKGFRQQHGIDYDETFASVCRYESIRLLIAIAAVKNLAMIQCDIKTAFLYGDLNETIYMRQPEGYEKGKDLVCHLRKSLYGLKQAPRIWNERLTEVLGKLNIKPTSSDPSVYIGRLNNTLVYIVVYVDDMLLMSESKHTIQQVIEKLKIYFQLSVCQLRSFVGFELDVCPEGIFLSQKG